MMVQPPSNYPYPDVHGPITSDLLDDEQAYSIALRAWKLSLTDTEVRSFAAEFRMGIHNPENYDGYQEYIKRFGTQDKAAKSASKKRKNRSAK